MISSSGKGSCAVLRPKFPFVLGNELAGEVIAVGSDVKRFRVGNPVFARVAKDRAGAFAEQASRRLRLDHGTVIRSPVTPKITFVAASMPSVPTVTAGCPLESAVAVADIGIAGYLAISERADRKCIGGKR